ncbi:hypothetical protein EOPP23_17915 [Endozoicomonas sp. OPT23]|uniref:hypothetical protein n=1 Tax=Endozoicomonas sp. OPT23 TaxID=2072845 RepID=UPI00129A4461|nr:hypothetical protein [Endozoicomonas sp. OPT23]MRI34857.1 hypothetical protein [Endozoicomonas sp. OPT23]
MLKYLCFFFLSFSLSAAAEKQSVYKVAIIDRFFPVSLSFDNEEDKAEKGWMYGLLDLDNDDHKEPIYHGDLVRLIAAHPGITFISYPILDGWNPMKAIRSNLQIILDRYPKQTLDALILSWESSTLISAFEKPLRLERADYYKSVVETMGRQYPVWQTTYDIILLLQQLSAKGVRVYTIAGNGGRNMVNTFSFAKGVTTVGAAEPELSHFVANNPFVDVYAQAAWQPVRVNNAKGKAIGYDLNGDKCVDIPLSKLTGLGKEGELPNRPWPMLKGSSFAAPAALRKALFKGLALTECHQ